MVLGLRAVQERAEIIPKRIHAAAIKAQKRPDGRHEATRGTSSEKNPQKIPKAALKQGPKRGRNRAGKWLWGQAAHV